MSDQIQVRVTHKRQNRKLEIINDETPEIIYRNVYEKNL
jgi:hypothetical protein